MSNLNSHIIQQLYNSICRYGYFTKKYNIDQNNASKIIEDKLKSSNIYLGGWAPESTTIFNDLIDFGIKPYKNLSMDDIDWFYHKILIKHGYYPQQKCFLIELIKLAFNIGTFVYCLDNNLGTYIYKSNMIEYYILHNLQSINTYIKLSNINLDNLTDFINNFKSIIQFIEEEITKLKKNKIKNISEYNRLYNV
jgi:hypothetical protein